MDSIGWVLGILGIGLTIYFGLCSSKKQSQRQDQSINGKGYQKQSQKQE